MKQKIRLKMSHKNSDTAYIALPGYPEPLVPGVVSKTLSLDDLIADYRGPSVNLAFREDGTLIGIEILVYSE